MIGPRLQTGAADAQAAADHLAAEAARDMYAARHALGSGDPAGALSALQRAAQTLVHAVARCAEWHALVTIDEYRRRVERGRS